MIQKNFLENIRVLAIAASLAVSGVALAQDIWEEDDGKISPQPVPTATATPVPPADKDCYYLDEKGCAEMGGDFYLDDKLCCF